MSIKIKGVAGVLKEMKLLESKLAQNIDNAVEKRTLLIINDTKMDTPRKTGKLVNSINLITQDTKPMERTYGTNVEYARRQEYEHKSKKAFFRNNITKHRPLLSKDVADAVKKTYGG